MQDIPVAVRYIQSSLESLDSIESDSVDIIHFFGVIEHLDSPGTVIDEFRRILKSNGYLIINCPIKYSLCYFSCLLLGLSPQYWGLKPTLRMRLDIKSKLEHYRFYSRKQLKQWLSGGFGILQRHDTQFSYAISYLGLLYRNIPAVSFTLQNWFDVVCRIVFLNHPSAVYWLVQKTNSSEPA